MKYFGSDVLTLADELTDAYVEIFTAPPWAHRDPSSLREAFRARLENDAHRPGFRALLSFTSTGQIEGFATGWTTQQPFRTDRAYGKVAERLGADRVETLLVGAFEIDELGVRSTARGTGLGRRLLSNITATAHDNRAWLLTWDGAYETVAFYRHLGWHEPEPRPGRETDVIVFLAPTGETNTRPGPG